MYACLHTDVYVSVLCGLKSFVNSMSTLACRSNLSLKVSFETIRKIAKIRALLSKDNLKTIVNSLVVSCLDYCNALYYGIGQKLHQQLQQIQNSASKLVMGKYKYDQMGNDLNSLHWLSIKKRVVFKIALLVFKSINGLAPPYLQELFKYIPHGHHV